MISCFLKGAYGRKVLTLWARVATCVPRDVVRFLYGLEHSKAEQSQPSPQSNTNPTGYSDKCFHLQLSSGDSERRQHMVWTCCSKECGSRYKLHRSSPRRLTCILFSFWSGGLSIEIMEQKGESRPRTNTYSNSDAHTESEKRQQLVSELRYLIYALSVSSSHALLCMLSSMSFTHQHLSFFFISSGVLSQSRQATDIFIPVD